MRRICRVTPCDAIAVLIIDDDASFRSGLAAILNGRRASNTTIPASYRASWRNPRSSGQLRLGGVDGMTFADRIGRVPGRDPDHRHWTADVEQR
jgi:hypothetical protein